MQIPIDLYLKTQNLSLQLLLKIQEFLDGQFLIHLWSKEIRS